MRLRSRGFPADWGRYAVADASVAAWRDPPTDAGTLRRPYPPYADSLAGLRGERIRAGARCGRFAAVRKVIAA